MVVYRAPTSKLEEDLVRRFHVASRHLYRCSWHPRLSVYLWEVTFVKGHAVDLLMLSAQTGCWAEWSLRHGSPMLVDYRAWLSRLKHPDKAMVVKRLFS